MVETIAECPVLVTDRKWCGCCDVRIASTAIFKFPSVPFLNPTAQERSGSQLAMHLAFRGAGADRAPADQIGNVLRRNHVEILDASRHSKVIESEQELTADAQAVIDHKTAVQMRIVNQALPAYRRSRLLEIYPHDDQKVRAQAILFLFQLSRVLEGSLGSWMEQGPMITRSRSSSPFRMLWMACLVWEVTSAADSLSGNSAMTAAGVNSSLISLIRRSSVLGIIGTNIIASACSNPPMVFAIV